MEIEATYIAKDGMRFNDPLACEEYEKQLGILPGSVGSLIDRLEKVDSKRYVFGTVLVRNGKVTSVYTRATVRVDDALESFVNISDLTEEQRYHTDSVGELVETMKSLPNDMPCQYLIVISPKLEFSRDLTVIANYNNDVWNKEQDQI